MVQTSENYMQYSERAIIVILILIYDDVKTVPHAEKYGGNSTIGLEKL